MSSSSDTLNLPPDFSAEGHNLGDYLEQEKWHALNPDLHIHDADFINSLQTFNVENDACKQLNELIKHEGYFQLSNLPWAYDTSLMVNAINRIVNIGLKPPFAFIYDEFWLVFAQLHRLLQGILGENYKYLPDFWVWRVDPSNDDSGWTPHRDRGHNALFPDGSPKSLTVWIPLSEASTLNSCMYLVPAHRDPTYNTPEEKQHRFALPDIRALPGKPGDAFIWNQAVLHWGSHSSALAHEPRLSMAFEFQRADVDPFNQPLMEPLHFFDFKSRLKLIGKQVLQYQHMYALQPTMKAFAERCCTIE